MIGLTCFVLFVNTENPDVGRGLAVLVSQPSPPLQG